MDESYIEELERELELTERLRSEMEGSWTMPIYPGVSVTISDNAPGYRFHCALAALPEEGNFEQFFGEMLRANVFFEGTDGGVLGLDSEGKKVTLSFESDDDASYEDFSQDLERYLNSVDYWRSEVQNLGKETQDGII